MSDQMIYVASETDVPNASLWMRVMGFVLDIVFFYMATSPISIVMLAIAHWFGEDRATMFLYLLLFSLPFLTTYFTLQEGLRGDTIGKKIAGLVVISTSTDEVSFGRAFLRTLLKVIPLSPVLYIFFRQKGLLHDSLAKTRVVERKKWLQNGYGMKNIHRL